ncbi:MAG: PHP domain-containing protein [Thermoplasmata archaeon]|nr:MAG: PHP domain-containing protein [Thermoplasmata archaeon]
MFDLHVHTNYSLDGHAHIKDIVKILRKKGFRGAAITDHNTAKGALQKHHFDDFLIIPGIEVSTEIGHILGIGINEEIKARDSHDVIDKLHEQGAIAIFAHPYRPFSPKNFKHVKFNAIETFNARSFPGQNKKAKILAESLKLPQTGGSDAHFLYELGMGYTIMNAESIDDAIEEILKGKTKAGGKQSFIHPLKCATISFYSYVKRGFRRV